MTVSMVAAVAIGGAVILVGVRAAPLVRARRSLTTRSAHRLRFAAPRRRNRSTITDVAAADWCEAAARSLRAGSTLTAALVDACTDRPQLDAVLRPVLDAVARGRSLGAVLDEFDPDPASPDGLVLAVLRSCADLGGPAAPPLERVAATLRTRAAIREEHDAHSAQARLSAKVLTLVPVALLCLLGLTEANVRGALATAPGLAAVTSGAALNLAGWHWMQRVIARDPRAGAA